MTLALLLVVSSCNQTDLGETSQSSNEENPYTVERTFPDYLLEHRKLFSEKSGTYQAGDLPVWTIKTKATNGFPVLKTTIAQLNAIHHKGDVQGNFKTNAEGAADLEQLFGYLDRATPAIYMHLR